MRALRVDAELAGRLAVTGPGPRHRGGAAGRGPGRGRPGRRPRRPDEARPVRGGPAGRGRADRLVRRPADRHSAAMWSAVDGLAGEYRAVDDTLSVPESRADALTDLVLRNVTVSAQVTLGVPVVTDRPAPEVAPGERFRVEWDDDETVVDAVTGVETRYADLDPASREELSWVEETRPRPERPRHPHGPCRHRHRRVRRPAARRRLGRRHHRRQPAGHPAPRRRPRRPRRRHRHPRQPDHHRLPAPEGHRRLRPDPRRHLPDVGLLPPRRTLRPRPHPSLARRPHHTHRARRPSAGATTGSSRPAAGDPPSTPTAPSPGTAPTAPPAPPNPSTASPVEPRGSRPPASEGGPGTGRSPVGDTGGTPTAASTRSPP